jgi:AraC-like DNA-binding protein
MPFFPIPVVSDRSLNAPILKLHQVLEVETTSALEQQSLVLDTLAQLILQYTEEPPTLRAIGQERTYIQRVRDYIEDHYAENIFLEQLAQVANLSPFHLNRAFSKEFGLPPHAYQTQSRIARSRTLLLDGWSIAQVAHETGFSNQSHFGWHFKRIVGVPPGQYTRDSKHLANKQQELDIPRGLS